MYILLDYITDYRLQLKKKHSLEKLVTLLLHVSTATKCLQYVTNKLNYLHRRSQPSKFTIHVVLVYEVLIRVINNNICSIVIHVQIYTVYENFRYHRFAITIKYNNVHNDVLDLRKYMNVVIVSLIFGTVYACDDIGSFWLKKGILFFFFCTFKINIKSCLVFTIK